MLAVLVRDTNPDERRPAPSRSSARKPSTVRRVLVAKQECSGCEEFKFRISSCNVTVSGKAPGQRGMLSATEHHGTELKQLKATMSKVAAIWKQVPAVAR